MTKNATVTLNVTKTQKHVMDVSTSYNTYKQQLIEWSITNNRVTKEVAQEVFEQIWVDYQHIKTKAKDGISIRKQPSPIDLLKKLATRKLIIIRVQNNDPFILNELYNKYRNSFIYRAKRKFGHTVEEAQDVFQETMVAFYNNIVHGNQKGKLTELTVDVDAYLYQIGDHKFINLIQNKKRHQKGQDNLELNIRMNSRKYDEQTSLKNPLNQAARTALKQLGTTCRELLMSYYFKRWCLEAIAHDLGYANANVVKTKKRKCLDKLAKDIQLVKKLKNIIS